jgi:hypothetical protein
MGGRCSRKRGYLKQIKGCPLVEVGGRCTQKRKTDKMKDLIRQILREELRGRNDFTSQEMRNLIFDIFSDNFVRGDEKYEDGIVDIYTIGEKTGHDQVRWSILNFFDTNRILKRKILEDLKKLEYDGDVMDGIRILLTDHTKLNNYINIVWNTIKKGFAAENLFVKKLTDKGYEVIYTGEPGTKIDKRSGVDVIVNGSSTQVKHADSVFPLGREGKFYRVMVKGPKMYGYKNKSHVRFIVFYVTDEDKFYIFPNSGYSLKHEEGENIFTFNSKPSQL